MVPSDPILSCHHEHQELKINSCPVDRLQRNHRVNRNMNRSRFRVVYGVLSVGPSRLHWGVLLVALLCSAAQAASPGLPFTEDFADVALRDPALTTANWDTGSEQLLLASWQQQYGSFEGVAGTAVGTAQDTTSLALGDVDGDGDLDMVEGNYNQPNRLFLNNGTVEPFNGVAGIAVGSAQQTTSLALGDLDSDGDLDLVAGISNEANRLFLNNGTANPFNGVAGTAVGSAQATTTLALRDMDGDGDLDLVEGNYNQPNRLFLNNGTAEPFNNVAGTAFGLAQKTSALALGDVDGDGDLDVLGAGPDEATRLFLNNGTADPFSGVTGIAAGVAQLSASLTLGDVDGDGDLDLVEGKAASVQANLLYLNNGTADPFNGVAGTPVGPVQLQRTLSLALGDVDGDGDLDLVQGNEGQPNYLFLNNGTAEPFSGVAGTAVGSAQDTRSLVFGDVDRDGDLDLVEGNANQPNRLFLNTATPNPFRDQAGIPVGVSASPAALAFGDVDGDGDADILVGDSDSSGGNELLLNNGTANPFNGVTGITVGSAQSTSSLALGDVDGDGDLDLVEGNYFHENRLFLNNGSSDPFNGVSGMVVGPLQETYSVVLGDMDGDGDLDLVEGNDGQANRLFLNNGTADPFDGVSGTAVGSAQNTRSLVVGDVNGDGHPDLVEGNDGQVNRLFLNNGTASPFNGIAGTAVGSAQATRSLALGDVDGDGDLDLVEGKDGGGNRLFLNNGSAADPFSGVTGTVVGSAPFNTSLALGDVDSDGDLDLLEGNWVEPNRVFLNNNTADPFGGVSGFDIGSGELTQSLALCDFDGDGDLDLVEGIHNPGEGVPIQPNRLFLNRRGPKPFNGFVESSIGSAQSTWWVTLGDVDGDGDLDLVQGNEGQPNYLFLNNGTADPFSGIAGTAVGSAQDTRSLAFGDVDGDGDLDLVEGNEGQANRLFLNNGTANPFNGVAGAAVGSAQETLSLALGDVDGDGDLDLLEGNFDQANRLFLNNGTANPFNGVAGTGVGLEQRTLSLVLGDVDRDGDLDLLEGNSGEANLLYLNNGTADPFDGVDGTEVGTAQETVSLALGDVDGDGDPDLVEGNWNQANRLFLNNGTADPFNGVAGTSLGSAQLTTSLALGDVDGDGDLDVLEGIANANEPNRLFLNNGTADPFNGVAATPVGSAQPTYSLALGDLDGDGWLDLAEGNYGAATRLLQRRLFNAARNRAGSLIVDTEVGPIPPVVLSAVVDWPDASANSAIDFYLSNDDGDQWYQVRPNKAFIFPTPGSELRWRTEQRSLSPVRTPRLQSLTISVHSGVVLFEDGFEGTPPP